MLVYTQTVLLSMIDFIQKAYMACLIAAGLRALIYNGDADMCVPHNGAEAWTRSLGLPVQDSWRPWKHVGQVIAQSCISCMVSMPCFGASLSVTASLSCNDNPESYGSGLLQETLLGCMKFHVQISCLSQVCMMIGCF